MICLRHRMVRVVGVIGVIAGVGLLLLHPVHADESADKGRVLLDQRGSSIVTVQMVTTQRMVMMGQQSQNNEAKSEATGMIIDSSGLVVFSLTSSDPSSIMRKMMGAVGSDAGQLNIETEVNDVKIRLPDGKELPSTIVLRDVDLDLVFVRPKEKPDEPLPSIDLTDTAEPHVLDEVVVLNRLGDVASWTTSARVERVRAVVEKPRTYYIVSENVTLGAPVFAMDGKVVGMIALRVGTGGSSRGLSAMFQGMSGLGMLPIIVPAEDIAEVAQQVDKSSE